MSYYTRSSLASLAFYLSYVIARFFILFTPKLPLELMALFVKRRRRNIANKVAFNQWL